MVFVGTMEGDDDELSFISIAAATANALRFLGLDQQKEGSGNEADTGKKGDQKGLEQREVRRRL